jgi:hypothetical protein
MATPADQLNQLLSTTLDTWRPKLMDQTIKKSSVLAALESKAKITVQGGNTIRQPLTTSSTPRRRVASVTPSTRGSSLVVRSPSRVRNGASTTDRKRSSTW